MKDLIIEFLEKHPESSSTEIFKDIKINRSYATLKRELSRMVEENFLEILGKGKATKYKISVSYTLINPIDLEEYFKVEVDDRKIINQFNLSLINDILPSTEIFNTNELDKLNVLQTKFIEKRKYKDSSEYKKEMERLAIDLSWKSSQIEGNTYSLLETEELLKYKTTAAGKTKDEAIMLLNHKEAIDFVIQDPGYASPLHIRNIEDIHFILTKELGIERNIRRRSVGISGTNYSPLDNEFQIIEALRDMCILINKRKSIFTKSFLALILISYIQPFTDGNKRTSRIISNAILLDNDYCPLSYRSVNSLEYKKAMLLFYEQNNFSAIKQIFIEQYAFAVENYF